jgi:hypothetical protein
MQDTQKRVAAAQHTQEHLTPAIFNHFNTCKAILWDCCCQLPHDWQLYALLLQAHGLAAANPSCCSHAKGLWVL